MDFLFSEQDEQFRQEIRDFVKEEVPPQWYGIGLLWGAWIESDDAWEFMRSVRRKLGAKGWLALTWPEEYGGLGRSHIEQLILSEEMTYLGAPGLDSGAVQRVGPILMAYGTEEQKRHLLPLARGEVSWSQGFSEPNAGSDLASLTTRAVEDGDCFILNGQKIWMTKGDHADWCYLLARTDPSVPKHQGISFFLLDMKSPGITVRPLLNMSGKYGFSEVFFDDVKIPKGNLVGEKNHGWQLANAVLNAERSGVALIANCRRLIDELVKYVNETSDNGNGRGQDVLIRQKLAKLTADTEVARLLSYRVACMQQKGFNPSHEASMARLFGGELSQRVAETGMEILGLYGQIERSSGLAPIYGAIEDWSLTSRARTIAGGTAEIQRTVIALRGLGLPRR